MCSAIKVRTPRNTVTMTLALTLTAYTTLV